MNPSIKRQKNSWENLAKLDPYWSILSDPTRLENKWNINDFYANGSKQVLKILTFLESNGFKVNTNIALDYGCGAGRLSESLSENFQI